MPSEEKGIESASDSTTGRGAARVCPTCGVADGLGWHGGPGFCITALRAALERADAQRCTDAIDGQAALDEANNTIVDLRRRLDEAREALRPMAEWFTYEHAQDDDIRNIRVRVGDIRRAAAVVKGE